MMDFKNGLHFGIAADDYEPGANTPGECAYWGCGNPDNTLILTNIYGLSGENGWNGTSMTVTNIWEDHTFMTSVIQYFFSQH